MRVTVHYFAVFREATGTATESLDTQAATAAELFRECMGRHAGLAHEPAALVAINDEMAGWDAPISPGDEVLFFPPVAGG